VPGVATGYGLDAFGHVGTATSKVLLTGFRPVSSTERHDTVPSLAKAAFDTCTHEAPACTARAFSAKK
jgi:hypothetical protein